MQPPFRIEMIDPAKLAPNPRNWRVPTAEGLAAIRAGILEMGWAAPLIYNERSQLLLDGHKRRLIFSGTPVPVAIGHWDPIQEAKILLYFDRLGSLSEFDSAAFAELIGTEGIETDSPELSNLLQGDWSTLIGMGDEPDEEEAEAVDLAAGDLDPDAIPARSDVPDTVWPSDNEFGIPTLNRKLEANAVDFPVTVWGSVGRKRSMRGTWCFYTDDRRFSSLFENPAAVFASRPATAIEPNFSTHAQIPRIVSLHRIYMKRWIARYWQSQGLRVFVDVNVDATARADNFLGVPKGWRAYATRSHGSNLDALIAEHAACCEHSGTDDLLFLVYGGGAAVHELADSRGWNWIPEHSQSVRETTNKAA
jgi:hypothetical protein